MIRINPWMRSVMVSVLMDKGKDAFACAGVFQQQV